MADLHFELVTPDKLILSEDVHMVVVPGTEGESGIMAGHAPYMKDQPADRLSQKERSSRPQVHAIKIEGQISGPRQRRAVIQKAG